MSKKHSVSTRVSSTVAKRGRPRPRPPRYLVDRPSGWLFQIRIPADLISSDSFLASSRGTLRVKIGAHPKKEAERRAALCANLCQAVFGLARENRETIMTHGGKMNDDAGWALVGMVTAACQASIASAMDNPSEAIGLARGLESALDVLKLVSREVEKGEAGQKSINENADDLVRGALASVLAHASEPEAAAAALAAVGRVAPVPAEPEGSAAKGAASPVMATAPQSTMPLFSEVSRAYIEMRGAAVGFDNAEVRQHELQRQLWLDIIGDRRVDLYYPRDLQTFVNAMKYWPRNASQIKEVKGLSNLEILKANNPLVHKPLSETSLKDKYVAFIKAMARHEMASLQYRDPFAGARIRYPDTATPARAREEIGADVVNRTFELGVQSGCLDTAMLPPLALLTTRRLGLLLYLRGSDIRQKNGVFVVQTDGIVQVNGVWQRVPYKTQDSTSYFVLHNFLVEIGFVEWAMRQEGWLFAQPHEHPDPSKYASKTLNSLLRQGGAAGQNVEVFHSFRGDAIDDLRDEAIQERSRRLQAGHEVNSAHDNYGRKAIRIAECKRIAARPLDPEIDWNLLRGLDFDALSKGRRSRGRKKKA